MDTILNTPFNTVNLLLKNVAKYFLILILFFNFHSYANNDLTLKPEVDVNFVILSKNKIIHQKINLQDLQNEIKILNKYFVKENGEKIFTFKFKNAHFYNDIKNSKCEFLKYGDTKKYNTNEASRLYWRCKDAKIRDPQAVNFYIVDSYSKNRGYKSGTSHGRNAGNHPFVLIDWKRLNHIGQSPEEHEMGHAFGLSHVCVEHATRRTPTNIMASSGNCKGSGGSRNIGFNNEQVIEIYKIYSKVIRRFNKD